MTSPEHRRSGGRHHENSCGARPRAARDKRGAIARHRASMCGDQPASGRPATAHNDAHRRPACFHRRNGRPPKTRRSRGQRTQVAQTSGIHGSQQRGGHKIIAQPVCKAGGQRCATTHTRRRPAIAHPCAACAHEPARWGAAMRGGSAATFRKSHSPKSSSYAQHIEFSITDSACKNQLVVVSIRYSPFNPYIPIRSTTIGKSRVAKDPIAMRTSWRSNSDIANSIGYPRMSASGESSTTMHRLLHESGSHPIPPPDDPNLSMHFDTDDISLDGTAGIQTSLPIGRTEFVEAIDDLRAFILQRIDDSNSAILSKLHTLERGLRDTLHDQDANACKLINSVCQDAHTISDVQKIYLNDVKKVVLAQGVTAGADSLEIRKEFKALDAKINSLDGQVAAIRNEQLEFQTKIAADILSLSTQLGDLVEYIRGGDAKKGEGSSSRHPLPTPVHQSEGTGDAVRLTEPKQADIDNANREILERMRNEDRERERRERSRGSRSGSYKRRRF
ncbi:hypothetical protein F511_43343 [Dorcoceras hygrometricum]|uniref:Uncharacterized protein n=1 Tax=Dorcoceras hygrometricum TaxID=472368 RepID=A0A2Z7BDF6_9LAMI|nr:hypothetical protein F511_43343 [Dorcoceras hygrometricum]